MIAREICYAVGCDDDSCAGDDAWDDGVPHFPTAEAAIEHATAAGWVILRAPAPSSTVRALCPICAANTECSVVGHRWEEWLHYELEGVRYRRRDCDRCGTDEHDPPWAEVVVLLETARIVDATGL